MKKIGALCMAAASMLLVNTAFAGDTTELLDNGQIEVAPNFGIGNIHDGKPNVFGAGTIGYGVTDFLTITGIFEWSSDVSLLGGGHTIGADALFTPLDTDSFDVDFHFGVSHDGNITITPGFEVNYDSSPEMDGWGVYARLDLPIYSGVHVTGDEEEPEEVVKTDFGIDVTLGIYYYIMENHQLVLEGGFNSVNLAKKVGKRDTEEGWVSLGWNYAYSDNFELVTEVKVGIPSGDDEDVYGELMIGGIFDFNPIK